MARHKSVRLSDELLRLITARMNATGSQDESATIREMLLDGAKSPRRPVLAQLGSREELLKFARLMIDWQQDFQSVRSRLAMALPDPKDEDLCKRVDAWRKLADDLEPRARVLLQTGTALAQTLLGLSPEDCLTMEATKQALLGWIAWRKEKSADPATSAADKTNHEKMIKQYETVLRALVLFGV